MPHIHDRGGLPDDTPIDRTEHAYAQWENHTHALLELLIGPKDCFNLDEFRRAIEGIEPARYEAMTYYERWIAAVTQNLIERGAFSIEELNEKMEAVRKRGETYGDAQGE